MRTRQFVRADDEEEEEEEEEEEGEKEEEEEDGIKQGGTNVICYAAV